MGEEFVKFVNKTVSTLYTITVSTLYTISYPHCTQYHIYAVHNIVSTLYTISYLHSTQSPYPHHKQYHIYTIHNHRIHTINNIISTLYTIPYMVMLADKVVFADRPFFPLHISLQIADSATYPTRYVSYIFWCYLATSSLRVLTAHTHTHTCTHIHTHYTHIH